MDELKEQKMEALGVAGEYCERLTRGIDNVVQELLEDRLEDTEEYLKSILDGINMVIQIYNRIKDLLIENSIVVDEALMNRYVMDLNQAMEKKDDSAIAENLKGLNAFVKQIMDASKLF